MPIVQQGSINTTALVVPDLYVQIVPPQNLLLNGVPTDIVGVVGSASWGPVGQPVPDAFGGEAAARRLKRLGGAVYVPPTNTNIGRISVVADPQTATLALVNGLKPGQYQPAERDVRVPHMPAAKVEVSEQEHQ